MRQHVARSPEATPFSLPTHEIPLPPQRYVRIRASQSYGNSSVVVGPFSTSQDQEAFKRQLCLSVPAIKSELKMGSGQSFELRFEGVNSSVKPADLIGSSLRYCLEHLKAGYRSRHS